MLKVVSALSRFLKGLILGAAAIAPGVSGGALAVIFGLYDKITYFIAHLNKDFKENILYFLPVGIGGLVGVLVFSRVIAVSYTHLDVYKRQSHGYAWGYIGSCIPFTCLLYTSPGQPMKKPLRMPKNT